MNMKITCFLVFILAWKLVSPGFSETPEDAKEWESLIARSRKKLRENDYDSGIKLSQQALKKAGDIFGREHFNVTISMNNLARFYAARENYPEAEKWYNESIAVRTKLLGASHPDTAESMSHLANCFAYQEKYPSAEKLFKQVLEIRIRSLGKDALETGETLFALGETTRYLEKFEDALDYFESALKIFGRKQPPDSPDIVATLENLATVHMQMGNLDKAYKIEDQLNDLRKKR